MVVIFSLIFINLLLWNIFIPVFELPSEQLYFHRVQEIYTHKKLPNLLQANPGDLSYPDTYPLLLTPIIAAFKPPNIFYTGTRIFDPQVIRHLPSQRGRFNRFFHPSTEQRLNWNNFQWSVHTMRFLTSLIYLLAVWVTYKTVKKLFADSHLPFAITLFVGFLPKMVHRAASLINMPLLFLSFSLFYYFALTRKPDPRTSFFLGLSAGLGIITKITGYNLIIFFLIYLLLFVKSHRQKLRQILTFGLGCFLISGWYFIRNWLLYGNPIIPILPQLEPPLPSEALASLGNQFNYWYSILFNTFQTFWDGFGWEVISLGRWFNFLVIIVTVTAVLGLVAYLPRLTRKLKFLIVTLIIYIITFLLINLKFFTPQGKDFMPLLLPISIIYILGLKSYRLINPKVYLISIVIVSTYFFSKLALINLNLKLALADALILFLIFKLFLWLPKPKFHIPTSTWPLLLLVINLLILFLVVSPKTFGDQNISPSEYYFQRSLMQLSLGQTLLQFINPHP